MTKILLLFLTSLLAYNSMAQINFIEVAGDSIPALANGEMEYADFDNDGDLDLLITGGGDQDFFTMMNEPTTLLYMNDGLGNFTQVVGLSIDSLGKSSLEVGDIDNDGDIDVFICGVNSSNSYESKIYKNNGSGVFTATTDTIVGIIQGDASFGDIDGDQDLDLIVTGYSNSGYITSLYTNDGTGSFSLLSGHGIDGANNASNIFLDIDNDNDLDIIVMGDIGSSNITKMYLNNGNGSFSLDTNTTFDQVFLGEIDTADVDGDNDVDVIITGANGANIYTSLYLNNGTGIFSKSIVNSFTGVAYSSAQFGDIDLDGDADLLISGYTGANPRATLLYENNGLGIFTKVDSMPFIGTQQFRNKMADFDDDGDLDIYLMGSSDGGSSPNVSNKYINVSCIADTAVVVNGLTLTAIDSGATYQWIQCSDSSAIPNATGQSYTVTSNGYYAVVVTRNSCPDTSACYYVGGVGLIKSISVNNIVIYPNPNNGNFTMKMPQNLSQNLQLQIYNSLGKRVYYEQIETNGHIEKTFDMSQFPNGVYFVNFTSENKSLYRTKLVIQH